MSKVTSKTSSSFFCVKKGFLRGRWNTITAQGLLALRAMPYTVQNKVATIDLHLLYHCCGHHPNVVSDHTPIHFA